MAVFGPKKLPALIHVKSEWQKNPEILTLWTSQCDNCTNLLSSEKISVEMNSKIFPELVCLKCHLQMLSIDKQRSTKV